MAVATKGTEVTGGWALLSCPFCYKDPFYFLPPLPLRKWSQQQKYCALIISRYSILYFLVSTFLGPAETFLKTSCLSQTSKVENNLTVGVWGSCKQVEIRSYKRKYWASWRWRLSALPITPDDRRRKDALLLPTEVSKPKERGFVFSRGGFQLRKVSREADKGREPAAAGHCVQEKLRVRYLHCVSRS